MSREDRIDSIIETLQMAWKANPDQRLAQLIFNAARTQRVIPPRPELFYIEDEVLAHGLRLLIEGLSNEQEIRPDTK